MLNKKIFLLIAIFLIWLGFIISTRGGYLLYEYYVSFEDNNVLIGITVIVAGILMFVLGLRKKATYFKDRYYICPNCEKTYRNPRPDRLFCTECDVKLEELKGFYERQPEKKQENKEDNS